MKKALFLLAIPAVCVMWSCSSDDAVVADSSANESAGDVYTLDVLSASSQAGRVTTYGGRSSKFEKLQLVATVDVPATAEQANWSTTGIWADGENVYVSWHSDWQAQTAATVWGGAVDVINGDQVVSTGVNYDMKFNNVLVEGGNIYLSATSAKGGGAIARTAAGTTLTNSISRIGFPGASVNAVAVKDGKLVAISGNSYGTYAYVALDAEAKVYTYSTASPDYANNQITPEVAIEYSLGSKAPVYNYFGGKDVKVVDGTLYMLRQDGQAETAQFYNGSAWKDLSFALTAQEKDAESYDAETEEWSLTGTTSPYYGKHIMSIGGGYAYIGAGNSGLKVVDLEGNYVDGINLSCNATCYADGLIYCATGYGLRVYQMVDGKLDLVAYQTSEYDADGNATYNDAAAVEDQANSYNFVAVANDYVYLACGQQGVKIFKLNLD